MTDDDDAFDARIAPFRKRDGISHLALIWWQDIDFDTRPRNLVKGILGIGECSVAYGDSGTGKSFIILDMSLHVAWGCDWFGHRVTQASSSTSPPRAAAASRHRVVAFRKHHGLAAENLPFALIASPVNLLEATPDAGAHP